MTYADSGFVVSLYRTTEGLSKQARREVQRAPRPVHLSPLSLLEIRNAFNMAIYRGEITMAGRDAILAHMENQMTAGFFRMADASHADIYSKATELSDLYTPEHLTRSLDLMHVAAALLVNARVFLSTDTRQRKVAISEGLDVRPA